MQLEDLVMVSVDDHVVEPPHVFEGRLPAKYADLAPKLITRPDGTSAWVYDGTEISNIALERGGRPAARRVRDGTDVLRTDPSGHLEHRTIGSRTWMPTGYSVHCAFPSFTGFCGQLFARTDDKDVALAMVQAYNDWHIDEWCGTYPGRFIPCQIPGHLGRRDHGRRSAAGVQPRVRTRLRSPRTPASWDGRASTLTTGTRSGQRAATRTSWSICTSARRLP